MICGRNSFLIGVFLSVALLGAWASASSQGKFLYAANRSCAYASAFTIDAATGALLPVPGLTLPGNCTADSLTVDPSGRFVYVADNFNNLVAAFAIDESPGGLTPVPGSPFPAGTGVPPR